MPGKAQYLELGIYCARSEVRKVDFGHERRAQHLRVSVVGFELCETVRQGTTSIRERQTSAKCRQAFYILSEADQIALTIVLT
jgi:hypothetical protein